MVFYSSISINQRNNMPIKKAAIKDLRTSAKRATRNLRTKRAVKAAVKSARASVQAGADEAEKKVLDAIKALDRAAAKKVIKKNAAARKKSRLFRSLRKKA